MRKLNCSSVADSCEWIETEITLIAIERRSVWRCLRPLGKDAVGCSRQYRHRSEYSRHQRPALCPLCGYSMKLIERYWQVKPVNHLPNGGKL